MSNPTGNWTIGVDDATVDNPVLSIQCMDESIELPLSEAESLYAALGVVIGKLKRRAEKADR